MKPPAPAPPVEATTIDRLVDGVYPAMALLGALRLNLFSPLAHGPLTADQVAQAAATDPGQTERLLNALVAAELVTRTNDTFDLTPEARAYLVADSPWSRTSSAELLHLFWESCLGTADVVSGRHDVAPATQGHDREQFLRSLEPDACSIARLVADLYSFPETGLLLDVGGGAGGAARIFDERYPQLQCCVVELPEVVEISRRLLDEAGGADVDVRGQDILTSAVRHEADVVWAQFLTQTMAEADASRAVANMVGALRPAGLIHLVNIVTDGTVTSRRADSFDLVLLNMYRSGKVHSIASAERWLEDAGAVCISTRRINDMVAITTGRAPQDVLL